MISLWSVRHVCLTSILVISQSLACADAWSATVTLAATDQGWYAVTGQHITSNRNYSAGWWDGFETWRNFFVFDFSGVGDTIVGATLRLDSGSTFVVTDGPSTTPDFLVTDTSESVASLVSPTVTGSAGQAKFAALGTGTVYGSAPVTNDNSLISLSLNFSAIEDFNATNGLFALSGRVTSPNERAFGTINTPPPVELILTTTPVPVPTTAWLLGSALGLLGWMRRKTS